MQQLSWTKTEALAPGVAGTEQTLRRMGEFVRRDARDVELRRFAARIVAGCRGHDFEGEAKALFEYVRDRITYRRDPVSVEMVQDARRTLATGVGDCDDKAVLLATLLATLGHRSRFRVLAFRESDPVNYQHVCLEVQLKEEWVPLDPTPERGEFGQRVKAKMSRAYRIWPQGGWSLDGLAEYDPYYTHSYLPDAPILPRAPVDLPAPPVSPVLTTPVVLPAPPPSPVPTTPVAPDPLVEWNRKMRKLRRRAGPAYRLPLPYVPPKPSLTPTRMNNGEYVLDVGSMNGLEGPLLQTGVMQAVGAIPVVGSAISTVMSLFGFGGGGGAAKKAQAQLDAYQQQLQQKQQELEAQQAAFEREQKRAGSAKVQARVAVKKAARGKTDEATQYANAALILLRGQSDSETTAAQRAMAVLQGGGQLSTPGGALDAYSVPAESLAQPAAAPAPASYQATAVPPSGPSVSPLLIGGALLLVVVAMSSK